ncbi:MAG: ferrous iron transport protein B [Candidatus Omnitrophota bacterium]|jgi:ferrous iron transport protein B
MNPRQKTSLREIALVGNPNSGKTSVFNALTGLRHHTANYPGVTVEKKTGPMKLPGSGEEILVLDLPGTYSLIPRSLDEKVVHDVLLGVQSGTVRPSLVVVVLDATNFERNLYLALQVIGTGLPAVLVLNMWDLAVERGLAFDLAKLETWTGCPCVKTVGNRRDGIADLSHAIGRALGPAGARETLPCFFLALPYEVESELAALSREVETVRGVDSSASREEALRLLGDTYEESAPAASLAKEHPALAEKIRLSRARLQGLGVDTSSVEAEARYRAIEKICADVIARKAAAGHSASERLDVFLTHPVWGLLFFIFLMAVIFQSIFTWAKVPMDWIASGINLLAHGVEAALPDGEFRHLLIDGILGGVGNVIVFLPQIFLLFFFIAFFEDTGYMARAAFVLDRIMKKTGLNGKAFLPLLSSFACAVPGILATRTIEDRPTRMAAILAAPFMSCSARLPIYALMIGALIPAVPVLGAFDLKGLTLLAMYLLSVTSGLGVAALFRKTVLRGEQMPFVFELPPYRLPHWKNILAVMWDRGREFLERAGSIIFCLSILLWFLVSYPRHPAVEARYLAEKQTARVQLVGEVLKDKLGELDRLHRGEEIRLSYAGRLGRWIEPAIRPLGFDWKIGIGIIGSFAAREVFVSTLAIVYNVGEQDGPVSVDLMKAVRSEISPRTGRPLYTPLVGVSVMVFFVLGSQCMSTLVVIKRETHSWFWPLFTFFYMTALSWLGAFAVYRLGTWLGWGTA